MPSRILALALAACSSPPDPVAPAPTAPDDVPVGEPASATIGPAGGVLVSTDGRLRLDLPAGALDADTELTVQEIAWGDGQAWSLTPDGTTFAVPVVATITLPEGETGAFFFHVPDDVEPEVTVAAGDGVVDYTLPLAHFSRIGFTLDPGGVYSFPEEITVPDGESFQLEVSAASSYEPRTVVLTCRDDAGVLWTRHPELSVRARISELVVEDPTPGNVERVGWVTATPDGFRQELRCASGGTDTVRYETRLEWELERDPSPDLCRVAEVPHVPGYRRLGTAIVVCEPKELALGESCQADDECVSGHCADGVCCDTACDEDCEKCDLPGQVGFCADVPAGHDDRDTCAPIEVCDGVGVCVLPDGQPCSGPTRCLSGQCADGVCCDSACSGTCETCDDPGFAGTCILVAPGVPDPGTCDAPDECGMFGECLQADGGACGNGSDCQSGLCADGVCCDEACDGECVACTAALNGGTDGQCGPIPHGTDVEDECPGEWNCRTDCFGCTPQCGAWQGMPCLDEAYHTDCESVPSGWFCRDGVCCDNNACTVLGECNSCRSVNTGVADGFCSAVLPGLDPFEECPLGECDGTGWCG